MTISNYMDFLEAKSINYDERFTLESARRQLDDLSKEYVEKTFLSPSAEFSSQWLNTLQEYDMQSVFIFHLSLLTFNFKDPCR